MVLDLRVTRTSHTPAGRDVVSIRRERHQDAVKAACGTNRPGFSQVFEDTPSRAVSKTPRPQVGGVRRSRPVSTPGSRRLSEAADRERPERFWP